MVKETKYGVIADVHKNPQYVGLAIDVLKSEGAQKLLVNGDIGGSYGDLKKSQDYTARILDAVGKSGLESFVQPGSHETLLGYGPVIEYFSGKYQNIIDTTSQAKSDQDDHHLIFIPGSDFTCGGEYRFGNSLIESDRYFANGKELFQFDDWNQFADAINRKIVEEAFEYFNINDVRKFLTSPRKTIVVCHVPRKFDNLENSVDMAEFGITEDGFKEFYVIDENGSQQVLIEKPNDDHYKFLEDIRNKKFKIKSVNTVHNGSIYPIEVARNLPDSYPVQIKKENRGNEDLKKLYEELGITKSVSAHFHESSVRASDLNGNKVPQDVFTKELFWNAGHLDSGSTGILTVRGEEVSYKNLYIGNYFAHIPRLKK